MCIEKIGKEVFEVEPVIPIYSIPIGNYSIDITTSVICQWAAILVLGICSFLLTRNLKRKPDKKQAALEKIYISVKSLVTNTMGDEYAGYVPYIGSLVVYLLVLNFMGLVGLKPPTQDISVAMGLSISTFIAIHYTALKRNGLGGYLKGYAHPFAIMLPINIMERVMLPVSLTLRLFGNMLAATVLVELVYETLAEVGAVFQFGAPIIVHGYFDLFDGTIQMLVFTMLTMIQIKLTAEE